jgi:hypothetical protein
MRALLVLAISMLAACSSSPELIWLGELESPCESESDCQDGPCLIVDGFAACSTFCYGSAAYCGRGYRCDARIDACVPIADGECRDRHSRCGPSFSPCCPGTACVDFGEWGARCARVGCAAGTICDDYSSSNGFCCIEAGDDTVCAPPTYCNG